MKSRRETLVHLFERFVFDWRVKTSW